MLFDQPRNRLFDFLSSPFRAGGECRRTTVRHRSTVGARLSWVARGQIHTVEARLLDISRAGAGLAPRRRVPNIVKRRNRGDCSANGNGPLIAVELPVAPESARRW